MSRKSPPAATERQERVIAEWRAKVAATGNREWQEWIGATPDSNPSPHIRTRIIMLWEMVCYLSGIKIKNVTDAELEHVVALSEGGENREGNLRPALPDAHKQKTKLEGERRTKANKVAAFNTGSKPKSSLAATTKQTRATGKIEKLSSLPFRQLYRDAP